MNKIFRTLIVDDEDLARNVIREYLESYSDIHIIGECSNGLDAVKMITELNPDLIFLDIQMPKLTGFEVLELTGRDFGIIFTTAYDQYALKAFDIHALDYLLKPFSQSRFDEALTHARKLEKIPVLNQIEPKRQNIFLERILIREGSTVHVIPVEKIDYIEAQDDYIQVHSEGKSFLKTQRLSDLEVQLDSTKFVRIHRSFILNLDKLKKIDRYGKDSHMAILKDGSQVPISRSGYDRVKEFL